MKTKDVKYTSFVEADIKSAIFLNTKIMEQFRPKLKQFYYDPSKYSSYLEQLGIVYPTLEEKK